MSLNKREPWYLRGECASDDPSVYLFCADLWANFAGPMAFGILFASLLQGCIIVLAIMYFNSRSYKSERRAVWWSVTTCVALLFGATLVEYTTFFRFYIVDAPTHRWDPGNVPFIPLIHVSEAMGIGATTICQAFFIHRAYSFLSGYYERLGKSTLPITIGVLFCSFCAIVSNASGVALMGVAGYIAFGKQDRSGLDAYIWYGDMDYTVLQRTEYGLYAMWLVVGAFVDFAYTSALCLRLFWDRNATTVSRTKLTAQRLFSYSLTTGLITTLPSIISVFFYYIYTYATVHICFIVVLPKLYCVTFLFTLISRDSLSKSLNKNRGQGVTLNLSSLPSGYTSNSAVSYGQPPSFRTEESSFQSGKAQLMHEQAPSFEKSLRDTDTESMAF